MSNSDIAVAFIEYFCAGDVDKLKTLLADNLIFTGTLYSYTSAEEYLAGLRDDPPTPCQYNILSITESCDSVAVFYEYQKLTEVLRIAQLFKFSNAKISEIVLIYDSKNLT